MIVGICSALGYVIKQSLGFIPNKYIPLIMVILGIIFNCWLHQGQLNPEILLGGLASRLASTGAFELSRNMMKK